jgi:hypothetical protein
MINVRRLLFGSRLISIVGDYDRIVIVAVLMAITLFVRSDSILVTGICTNWNSGSSGIFPLDIAAIRIVGIAGSAVETACRQGYGQHRGHYHCFSESIVFMGLLLCANAVDGRRLR